MLCLCTDLASVTLSDHCYDCAAEAHIWREYLLAFGTDTQRSNMSVVIAEHFSMLSSTIDPFRTLSRPGGQDD